MDGKLVEDNESLMEAWTVHFGNLTKSRKNELPLPKNLDSHMEELNSLSHKNEDFILDEPFTIEEIGTALRKMKKRKSPGPDNLTAEHLLHGGEALANWLMKIFNKIVTLEEIPESLKSGIIVPVYKGNGKDPLLPGSYRGTTLSSVMAKVLETLLLNRLQIILSEANIPHPN